MSSCAVVIPDIYRGVFNFQEEKRRKEKEDEREKEEQQSGFTITILVKVNVSGYRFIYMRLYGTDVLTRH